MIEIEINDENLNKFIKDIRKEDKEELLYHFKKNAFEKFKNICKKCKNSYFVADNNLNPIAIGGFEKFRNKNTAQVWLLCTNKLKSNKKELYKYIKEKVRKNKRKYSILFNCIYKSNFESLKFLKRLGFKVVDLIDTDFKMFYLIKGEKDFDLRSFTDK